MSDVSLWLVALAVWFLLTRALRKMRRWLPYYLTGSFGFVILMALGAAIFDVDTMVESVEAIQSAALANTLGISVYAINGTGLAIPADGGWAIFDITLECSAILEMATIVALVCFYPGSRPLSRATKAALGVVITYAVNLARIVLIVAVIAWQGTSWVFVAHAVIGRIFFLTATIALYWFIITRPTMSVTRRRLTEDVGA